MRRTKRQVGFLLSSCLLLYYVIASCAMPTITKFEEDDPTVEELFRTSSTVSIIWVYENSSEIDSYNLYYRSHGSSAAWSLLSNVSADAPYFAVDYNTLGEGKWDFAVAALDSEGNESDIHTSLDMSANPSTGWYLLWAQ